MNKESRKRFPNTRRLLFAYDIFIFFVIDILLLILYDNGGSMDFDEILVHTGISFVCLFVSRICLKIYSRIWCYSGIQCCIRLFFSDGIAFCIILLLENILPMRNITFEKLSALVCMNCLSALAVRMIYRYVCMTGRFSFILKIFKFGGVSCNVRQTEQKIRIAIVGAGNDGVTLAEELLIDPVSPYVPQCFIEISTDKAGRCIHDLPILSADDTLLAKLKEHEVQEIVFAAPHLDVEKKKELYEFCKNAGFKVKVYDAPTMEQAGGKRTFREFNIEELLFRKPIEVTNEKTCAYYRDRVVMITGGGGSIGSELCRQIAKMQPKRLVILDVYENGAYDVQQELKIRYGAALDVKIVIVSVCNRVGLERAFRTHRPQIVINAAAHKHVPLMEDDCVEAVENNVFGTLNSVELSEKYGVERFIMVSTDKAVNPTNVMGATKRMCEMIVLSHKGNMTCSATRFGNVLGSAGSVIPLFRRQIAAGGPVTITHKDIIRYFMTIQEAAQLVLQSGAMAKDKELFVLDMGQPVKILELAENMIRLSGQTGIEIIETGLRPGEKLYEELLVKTEELDKTENDLIFIERDKPLDAEEVQKKLVRLREAVASDDNETVRQTMHEVVPTFKTPEGVNNAHTEKETQNA